MLFPTMIENGGMEVLLHLNDQKCEKWGEYLGSTAFRKEIETSLAKYVVKCEKP